MIAKHNKTSLIFGVPGLMLQIGGRVANATATDQMTQALGLVVMLIGSALLVTGLVFYAKAKGRNPAWGLMGLLSIIGLIVLALLKDKAPEG